MAVYKNSGLPRPTRFFLCNMQPFDVDDLMHGVIVTREGFECHHPVEFEYYSNPKPATSWFDASSCAYCAGSSGAKGFVDDNLSIEWKSVLPICQDCRAYGALPLARTKRKNGAVNGHRTHRNRLTADVSQAHVDVVTLMVSMDMPLATTSTAPRSVERGRRVDSEVFGKLPRCRVSRRV